MKRFYLIFGVLLVLLAACTKRIYVPVEKEKIVTVHDTTKIHTTDTLIKVPEVSIGDFIDLEDTLRLKADGAFAEAEAWVDKEHNVLAGRLKQTGKIPVQIQWKERVIVKDSIDIQEVPVPVEVTKEVIKIPLFYKIFAVIGLAFVFGLLIYLGMKRF